MNLKYYPGICLDYGQTRGTQCSGQGSHCITLKFTSETLLLQLTQFVILVSEENSVVFNTDNFHGLMTLMPGLLTLMQDTLTSNLFLFE